MPTVRDPRRRGNDARRAELVKAAARVIAQDGVAAATTRRIADEAGVPQGLVHYWFAGKDELLEAVIAEFLHPIESAVAAQDGDQALSGLDRLRAALHAIEHDDRGRHIAMYEMTTWALRRPELADVPREQYAQYRRLVNSALGEWSRDTGISVPGDPGLFAQFLVALIDGLTLAWLADPDGTDIDGVLRLVSDLVEKPAAPPVSTGTRHQGASKRTTAARPQRKNP